MLKFRSGEQLSFDEYITQKGFCGNYPLYSDIAGKSIIIDRVAKYEQLNEELSYILTRLGIPFAGKLAIHAKADYRQDRRPYQDFFSGNYRKYRHVIAEAFHQEITMHGYIFN